MFGDIFLGFLGEISISLFLIYIHRGIYLGMAAFIQIVKLFVLFPNPTIPIQSFLTNLIGLPQVNFLQILRNRHLLLLAYFDLRLQLHLS